MIEQKKKKKSKRRSTMNKNTLTPNSKAKGKFKPNIKVRNAVKCTYDGIKFQSGLEVFMYKQLESQDGFEYHYEKFQFLLQESFKNIIPIYEKSNSTKSYGISSASIRAITYTPDFLVFFDEKAFIIETKGLRTDAFTLRFKLFKKLMKNGLEIVHENKVYMLQEMHLPTNQDQCKTVLNRIVDVWRRDNKEREQNSID